MPEGFLKKKVFSVADFAAVVEVDSHLGRTLNRVELLDALKTEIAAQENISRRPGWTAWALLGALSAISWFCLNELETGRFLKREALAALLIGSFLIEIWDPFRFILEPRSDRPVKSLRFFPWQFMGSMRVVMIAYIGRYACLFAGSLQFTNEPKGGVYLSLYSGALLVSAVFGFFMSYSDFIFPMSNNARTRGLSFLMFVVGLLGIVWLVHFTIGQGSMDFSSIRLGLATAAGLLLFIVLCEGMNPPPVLTMLLQTQRDLSFENITVEDAHCQADIALAGLRMGDVFLRELQPLAVGLEKMNRCHKEASDRSELAKKMINEKQLSSNMKGEELQVLTAILESAKLHLWQIREIASNIDRHVQKTQSKLQPAFLIEPQVKVEFKSILDRFKQAQEDCQRDCDKMETEIKAISASLPGAN